MSNPEQISPLKTAAEYRTQIAIVRDAYQQESFLTNWTPAVAEAPESALLSSRPESYAGGYGA